MLFVFICIVDNVILGMSVILFSKVEDRRRKFEFEVF